MTTGLEALDADRRGRMVHIEACRVAESRGTHSWDLRSFDAAGILLSLDHFHFDGS
ncbi:hypothetical protein [Frondihabitans peucedani]|uniref:Uncharacterized protein n=1 Tax=Frondihabitans peucedani TaxID=598626 RepID=A0ABP8E1X9_9MICO